MVHSATLKKIHFCLVLLFCQSVQLLKTGYVYPKNVVIENDILYEDLRCTYLFSGLTHMVITKILLSPEYNTPIKLTVGHVSFYINTVRYQIASLYSLKVTRMRSLWLLHLYMNLNIVPAIYKQSLDIQADYLKLMAIHEYVIQKIRSDLTRCRYPNSYYMFDDMIKSQPNPTHDELKEMVYRNYDIATGLLNLNEMHLQSPSEKCLETIKIKRLFMNNMGNRSLININLITVFNVQVQWSDIITRLKNAYVYAHTMNWTTDNLQSIKSYYTLYFSVLKIIIFRLTLKHLKYLQYYLEGSDDYVRYAYQWYYLVKKFGVMFDLTNELHVKSLLTSVNNLFIGEEKIDSVVSYVISILYSLCLPLACISIKPFILDGKEFEIPYEKLIDDDPIIWEITNSGVPIEFNSLENTRIFLNYLGQVFEGVDFSLIQSLIEYIDEIKLENHMERLNYYYNNEKFVII